MQAQVWYVTVYVFDFEGAIEFYRDRLGFELRFVDPELGHAAFGGEGTGFAVARVDPDSPTQDLVGRHTGIGLAVSDLHRAYVELRSKGVEFTMPPTRQAWGGMLSMIRDLDGNILFLDQRYGVGPRG